MAQFQPCFARTHGEGMLRKLGLAAMREGDAELGNTILADMQRHEVDFTLFFRRLADAQEPGEGDEPVRALFRDPAAADAVLGLWRARLALEPRPVLERRSAMNAVNPAYIPRNHRIEAVIRAAIDEGDLGPFEELRAVLSRPFDPQPKFARYQQAPLAHERVRATFCGT